MDPNDRRIDITEIEKPPLGLRPAHVIENERAIEIAEAMLRYLKAGKLVPEEWRNELNERLHKIKKDRERT